MLLEEYCDKYFDTAIIDLKKELTEKEIEIIEKLEVKIEDRLYTAYKYEDIKETLGIYCSKNDKHKELKYKKPEKYGISKEEYDLIIVKFNKIDNKYEELLGVDFKRRDFNYIWFKEKQCVRDKLIIFLEEHTLDDIQKQKLLNIIMSMKNTTIMQKERFILYYGLDQNKEKIHSASKIAKLQNCSTSNIRQAINKVKSKIPRLEDEEIDIIREMIK